MGRNLTDMEDDNNWYFVKGHATKVSMPGTKPAARRAAAFVRAVYDSGDVLGGPPFASDKLAK